MTTLYMIGGAMGVGKTAVSLELLKRLPNAVFLDGDWCWRMDPFVVTESRKSMVEDNIAHLLSSYINDGGFENVVFCWVLHEDAIINDIISRLPMEDVRLVNVSLVCSRDELLRRISLDVNAGKRTPDVAERAVERLSHYADLATQKLDTTSLTIDETAERLVAIPAETF